MNESKIEIFRMICVEVEMGEDGRIHYCVKGERSTDNNSSGPMPLNNHVFFASKIDHHQ